MLKQHSAHQHEVDHQLGSTRHRVFQSFKPRTLSGRRVSSDHMIFLTNKYHLFLIIQVRCVDLFKVPRLKKFIYSFANDV